MASKSFDKAFEQLQNIVDKLQGEDISIDKLSTELKKANELVKFCKDRLREVESDIEEIANDEA